MGHPDLADLTGTDVLVAIEMRTQLRLGIVEVKDPQAIEPDSGVELGEQAVCCLRVGQSVAGAPGMSRVQAEADPSVRDAAGGDRSGDPGQLIDGHADPETAAGRVLEEQDGVVGLVLRCGEAPDHALGDPLRAGPDPRIAMRTRVDVDERRPEAGRHLELATQDLDGPIEEVRVRTGQVHEIRRVDRDRSDVELRETGPEGGLLAWRLDSSAPGRRVVAEDLERRCPDLRGPLDGTDHPGAERKVSAESSAIGQHRLSIVAAAPSGRWLRGAQPRTSGSE